MILGVISARGGSKGIPKKNIQLLVGKPLITWTIKSAQQSIYLDRFIVSTDDKKIAKISKLFGAEVLMRPPELATDTSPIIDTLQHIQKKIDFDLLVLLQPTSPIRNKGRIDEVITYHINNFCCHSTATGRMCSCFPYGTNTSRRQDREYFYDDGSIYVVHKNLIEQGLLFDDVVGKFITTKEENMEIDDEFDFWLCEQILKKRMRKK